jgi:hypothetical protein
MLFSCAGCGGMKDSKRNKIKSEKSSTIEVKVPSLNNKKLKFNNTEKDLNRNLIDRFHVKNREKKLQTYGTENGGRQ